MIKGFTNKKILICVTCIILVLLILSVLNNNGRKDEYNLGIKYDSVDFQNELLTEMKKKNISFNINKEGMILYRTSDSVQVEQIMKDLDDKPAISISDLKEKEFFLNELKKQKIPYKKRKLIPEDEYIVWDKENDATVQDIIKNVLDKGQVPIEVTKEQADKIRAAKGFPPELFQPVEQK